MSIISWVFGVLCSEIGDFCPIFCHFWNCCNFLKFEATYFNDPLTLRVTWYGQLTTPAERIWPIFFKPNIEWQIPWIWCAKYLAPTCVPSHRSPNVSKRSKQGGWSIDHQVSKWLPRLTPRTSYNVKLDVLKRSDICQFFLVVKWSEKYENRIFSPKKIDVQWIELFSTVQDSW